LQLRAARVATKSQEIPSKVLAPGTAIEDHFPIIPEIYARSVAQYVGKVLGTEPDELESMETRFLESFGAAYPEGQETKEVAAWVNKASSEIARLKEPSKIGIAREYLNALSAAEAVTASAMNLKRARALALWIKSSLQIPSLALSEPRMFHGKA
jgi:hypothetical protein